MFHQRFHLNRTFTGARRGYCFGGQRRQIGLFEFMKFCLITTNKFSLRHRVQTGFQVQPVHRIDLPHGEQVENTVPSRCKFLLVFEAVASPKTHRYPSQKADDIGAKFALPPSFTEMMRKTGKPKYRIGGSPETWVFFSITKARASRKFDHRMT